MVFDIHAAYVQCLKTRPSVLCVYIYIRTHINGLDVYKYTYRSIYAYMYIQVILSELPYFWNHLNEHG